MGRKETVMDFDKHAANWDKNDQHARRNNAVAAGIKASIPLSAEMRALEFGCGTGELTLRLAPALGSVLATDASGGMIEQLEVKLSGGDAPNVRGQQLDLLDDPLAGEQFDLIYSAMTLHHVEDVPLLFARLSALLSAKGFLVIADLCTEDGSFHGETEVPHLGFSEEELKSYAERVGLRLESCGEVFAVEKNERRYPVFLAIFRH